MMEFSHSRPMGIRKRNALAQALGLFTILFALCLTAAQAQVTPTDSVPAVKGGKGGIKGGPAKQDSVPVVSTGKGGKGNIKGSSDSLRVTAIDESDSTKTKRERHAKADSTRKLRLQLSPKKEFYDPRIAWKRSAVLPGWGQVYNNRIWKVPIIYAGFATFAAFIIGNHREYAYYDRAVKCTDSINFCVPNPYSRLEDIYGAQGLISIREQYRRARDFNIILTGLWYVLNIVDAYVDAHLRGFNVSDDLSLDFDPDVMLDPFRRRNLVVGASLTLHFR